MKAAYYEGNRTFTVKDAQTVLPGPGDVRLDVAYCGICGTDLHIYHGAMDKRVDIPQTTGHEASATVAEVGEGVEDVKPGDKVVVRPLDNRGETSADRGLGHISRHVKFIGIDTPGAFQNSWTVPAFTLHKVPSNVDIKTAALAEPLAVACHDVRMGCVAPGELVVVVGAGPIGLLVALVARDSGAEVVVSEVNASRLAFAREQGFEAVNPMETDLAELCRSKSDGSGADVVFEVSGAKSAALAMTDPLALRGRIVVVAVYPQPVEINLFQFFWKELSMQGVRVYEPEDYDKALALMEAQTLPLEAMITKVAPLDRINEAFAETDTQKEGIKTLIDCRS